MKKTSFLFLFSFSLIGGIALVFANALSEDNFNGVLIQAITGLKNNLTNNPKSKTIRGFLQLQQKDGILFIYKKGKKQPSIITKKHYKALLLSAKDLFHQSQKKPSLHKETGCVKPFSSAKYPAPPAKKNPNSGTSSTPPTKKSHPVSSPIPSFPKLTQKLLDQAQTQMLTLPLENSLASLGQKLHKKEPQYPLIESITSSGRPTGNKKTLSSRAIASLLPAIEATTYQAEQDSRLSLIDAAQKKRALLEKSAKHDETTLDLAWTPSRLPQLLQRFQLSQKNLIEIKNILPKVQKGLDPSERDRFSKAIENAHALAQEAAHITQKALQRRSTFPGRMLASLLQPPRGLTPTEEALFNLLAAKPPFQSPLTADALARRYLKFYGLFEPERKKAQKNLKLLENPLVTLKNKVQRNIALLHNGYFLGANKKTAFDCSSFISQLLNGNIRWTTKDFYDMWTYLKKGTLPRPPNRSLAVAQSLVDTAQAFEAIDWEDYHTELLPGDLIVFRLPGIPMGHIYLVEEHNIKEKKALVMDAAQSTGTIHEHWLPLTYYASELKMHFARPGFYVLRMHLGNHFACTYQIPSRPPARKVL